MRAAFAKIIRKRSSHRLWGFIAWICRGRAAPRRY